MANKYVIRDEVPNLIRIYTYFGIFVIAYRTNESTSA